MMNSMHSTTPRFVMSLAVGTFLLVASCVDLTETPITGITSKYYSTPEGFNAAVNASYEGLRSFYGQEMGLTLTVFGTDEFRVGADGSHKSIGFYNSGLNGDESYFRDTWRAFYRAINTANTAIADSTVNLDPTLRTQRIAEARFLRGLYYFNLVRMWGPVPLLLSPTQGAVTTAQRDSVDAVYTAIVSDLLFAEANLPDVQTKDYGRATKPAAQHLLALVYLTRQAPGDNALAAAKAQAVIANTNFKLLTKYSDIWALGNERNAECVWAVQFTDDPLTTGPGNSSHLYFLMAYELWPGMVRDMANGRAFKRFRPTDYLLNLWDRTKDSRYDDSFTTVYYANNPASIPKNPDGSLKYQVGDTAVFMPGTEWTAAQISAKRYSVLVPSKYTDAAFPSFNKKFIEPNRLTVNDTRGSRDWQLFRLAETYLIAAEALMRDGNVAAALPYVNAVRERAAKPGVLKTDMDITAAQLNLDFILDERSRELAGEGMRWFDLVRTSTLVSRVKLYNNYAQGGFNPATAIQAYHVRRPIPTEQITLTIGGFPQNTGY